MSPPKIADPPRPRFWFPLSAHTNGQWAKIVDGETWYFGAWSTDPTGRDALLTYTRWAWERANLAKPVAPIPELHPHPGGMWRAKVDGEHYYFGSWRSDPRGNVAVQLLRAFTRGRHSVNDNRTYYVKNHFPDALWDGDEVREFLNCSHATLLNLTKTGDLPAVRVGRKRRYRPDDVRAFASRRDTAPLAKKRKRGTLAEDINEIIRFASSVITKES